MDGKGEVTQDQTLAWRKDNPGGNAEWVAQEEEEGLRRKGRRAGRDKGDKGGPVEARKRHTRKHTSRQKKKEQIESTNST